MTERPTSSARRRGPAAALVFASLALASGGTLLLRGPSFVDRVSVRNPSEYDIHVEASGDDGKGWMSIATADQRSTSTVADVLDQGAVWLFRFRAQGRPGGELRITRTELRASRWSIEVPAPVVDRLRQLQTPPTP